MDVQKMINDLSKEWALERSESQLTLGEIIVLLEQLDPKRIIPGLGDLHSYRGYYSDLAFDINSSSDKTVKQLLQECKSAVGTEYQGWKGGEFKMSKITPLFVAHEGSTGLRLMGIVDGKIVTSKEPE
jgi:hypothetical protein